MTIRPNHEQFKVKPAAKRPHFTTAIPKSSARGAFYEIGVGISAALASAVKHYKHRRSMRALRDLEDWQLEDIGYGKRFK